MRVNQDGESLVKRKAAIERIDFESETKKSNNKRNEQMKERGRCTQKRKRDMEEREDKNET
jgi:hypothetical protein